MSNLNVAVFNIINTATKQMKCYQIFSAWIVSAVHHNQQCGLKTA